MLYGRLGEQERVRALLDAARDRRSGALLVVGEPGAGKSALLDEARAEARDMAALEARGVQSESRLPYASLYQLLRPALGALERIPRAQAAALESALGLREDTTPDLYRVPLAVLTLLAEVAEEGPLLCIVDDAQWIDHDSEQALVFAARRLHAEGAAMLFAAREREFQPGVLPELRLRPLDDVAVLELLADRSGTAVTEDVARRVAAATGGNALAVAELASLLTPAQLAARAAAVAVAAVDGCRAPVRRAGARTCAGHTAAARGRRRGRHGKAGGRARRGGAPGAGRLRARRGRAGGPRPRRRA